MFRNIVGSCADILCDDARRLISHNQPDGIIHSGAVEKLLSWVRCVGVGSSLQASS